MDRARHLRLLAAHSQQRQGRADVGRRDGLGPQRRRRERRAPRRRGALLGEQRGVGVRRGEESGEAGGEADLILGVHGTGLIHTPIHTHAPDLVKACIHQHASHERVNERNYTEADDKRLVLQ